MIDDDPRASYPSKQQAPPSFKTSLTFFFWVIFLLRARVQQSNLSFHPDTLYWMQLKLKGSICNAIFILSYLTISRTTSLW